jgi:hypothetical protein
LAFLPMSLRTWAVLPKKEREPSTLTRISIKAHAVWIMGINIMCFRKLSTCKHPLKRWVKPQARINWLIKNNSIPSPTTRKWKTTRILQPNKMLGKTNKILKSISGKYPPMSMLPRSLRKKASKLNKWAIELGNFQRNLQELSCS